MWGVYYVLLSSPVVIIRTTSLHIHEPYILHTVYIHVFYVNSTTKWIISLQRIDRLVCTSHTLCVYCAVRNESSIIIPVILGIKPLLSTHAAYYNTYKT